MLLREATYCYALNQGFALSLDEAVCNVYAKMHCLIIEYFLSIMISKKSKLRGKKMGLQDNMRNKSNTTIKRVHVISIIIAIALYIFLLIEWFNPVSTLPIFIGAVMLSIFEIICVMYAIKKYRDKISCFTLVLGTVPSLITLFVFCVGMIMGVGA